MAVLKDEQGLTLIELLGALTIFGIVSILLSSILFNIAKASSTQGRQVEIQQTANNMVVQIEDISKLEGIYAKAGYYGKFQDATSWNTSHIVKVLDGDSEEASEIGVFAQGENTLFLTDINDNLNKKVISYRIQDTNIKIKVLQQKNENSQTKTIYGTPNYRDLFSIQTTGVILFYQHTIDFSKYYDSDVGVWQTDKLLGEEQNKIIGSRKFVVNYRDDQKAKGEVPGNGRW